MADNSWRDLEENWERVKWARSQVYESAAEAADAMRMQAGTYRCYERGPDKSKFIELSYRQALQFGREFKVRWEWLLDGEGTPWLTPPTEVEEEPALFDDIEEGPPNNLRAWREHKGLTVEKLASKANISSGTISDIESGARELSRKLRDQLAHAMGVTSGYLLALDPTNSDLEVLETFSDIPEGQRKQALEILRTFRKNPKERPGNDT